MKIKNIWKSWRLLILSADEIRNKTFYPQEKRKSNWIIRLELWKLHITNQGSYNAQDTISHYFSLGVDRKGEKCQKYVFQKEYDELRDRRHSSIAHVLDSKWITAKYLSACGVSISTPVYYEKIDRQKALTDVFIPGCDYFAKPEDGMQGKGNFSFTATGDGYYIQQKKISEAEMKRLLENYIVERKIEQHPDLSKLYPHAVASIRLVTIIKDGHVELFSSFILVGSGGSCLSNGRAGGIAIGIDQTGRLCTSGHKNASPHGKYEAHPDTGIVFMNYRIPMWEECLKLAIEAHSFFPSIYSIGWDIAIGEGGPIIIEANRDWGTLLSESIFGADRARIYKYLS